MLSYFKLATAALITLITIGFSQDVTLTIDGTSLNYESSVVITGWQFDHDGCVSAASGGASADAGFTITCSSGTCLGFSFSGGSIPAGSGLLVDLGGECETLTGLVFAGEGGVGLEVADCVGVCGPDADHIVEVSNYAFTPDHLNIAAGETVEWVNLVGSHNVDGSTDTYPDNPESFYNGSASSDLWSYSFTFTVAGNYDYECTPHAPSMAGTITVGSGGCTDDMACNYDADADFDDGSCLNNDCADVCGGSAEVDECGVCGGGGAQLQDCWFDGDGDGCFETLDTMTTCSCEWEGGSSTGGDCGPTDSDGDGVLDDADSDPNNPYQCSDNDNDTCDDCSTGMYDPANDGWDYDGDGACDAGDMDDDNDGVPDDSDCDDNNMDASVEDCAGECGGSAVDDECGVCGGGGAQLQDCWFDGDADGCYETLDSMTTCSCEWEGGSSTGGDCGSDTSNVDVLYCSDADIYGFQFFVNGVNVVAASGGAAEANGFTTSTGNNTVLSFSFSGASIPGNMCDILTTLEVEGDASAACLSDLVLSGENGTNLGGEITDCLTVTYTEPACDDVDEDGICDDVDDCVGAYDDCGVCNGGNADDVGCGCFAAGPSGCDNACGSTLENDECGVCGGDGIADGTCDCAGNVEDACGVCGGDETDPDNCDDCSEGYDACGVCGGIATDETDCFIELSIGSVADGVMEIILNNTIPLSGFQFELTGVALEAGACSGGSAGDAGFQVSNSESGLVLGFSMEGVQLPQGNGVLTNVAYTAIDDLSCITNEVLALGEWAGGFYEINIGGCAALDFGSAGCTDESACNYDADVDADDGSCYYDEAGCTEGVSGECEAAGGVGGYTFDGCAEIATSDEFLASCEALGVGASIELACMGAGGSQEDCAMLAMIYEMAFSGDCNSAIAHAISDDSGALCTLAGDIAEDTYTGCDDLAASGCAETCGDETFTADVLYDSDSDFAGFQFHVDGDVTVTGVSGGAAGAAGFTVSTGSNNVIGFSLTGSVVSAGAGTLLTLEYTGDGSPCLSALILSDPDANGLDATIVDCLTISYEAPVSGCTDVDACNYNADADEDDGSCTYAEENYDCDGNCTAEVDCAGECGGSAVEDCAGECGGSSVVDECGECGDDGSSCAPGVYGLALNDDGGLDVTFDSPDDIYGFQFDVSAVTVTGVSGGAAADAGFTTSTGNNTVLGFSFSGSFIPAGSGVLTVLSFEGSGEACLSNIIVSGIGGSGLDTASGDCATIDEACESGIYDCAGVCNGDAVEDCAGECGGDAASDDCGVCNGGNADDLGCGCFEPGPSGCDNTCGSTLENDECGICGGDGSSCAPGVYGLALNDDGGLDVTFDSPDDIYGFQFDVSAVTVTGASGGAAADAGFSTSTGNNTVLGFSFSGDFIPAGSGVLTVLSFEGSGEACLSNIVVAGPGGSNLDTASGDCVTIEDCESGIYDCAGVCDGTAVEDCAGECGGSAEVDECGECGGGGIADGACDCAGNVEDCAGECGGSAEVDECGVCGGDGIADGACDCAGNVADCAGECGGSAEVDECGECGGDGIADGACDCDGNVADCAGECGGSAENCPDWQYDPGLWFETAWITSAVYYDDIFMGDEGDMLAAFDGDGTVRGVAVQVTPINQDGDPFGPYAGQILYEITIGSNDNGDNISFQYYDASEDAVIGLSSTYSFNANESLGDFNVPYELLGYSTVDLSIDLAAGWNWISFNVVPEDASLNSVLASVGESATFIASQSSGIANNYGADGWGGSLSELDPTDMYKINMSTSAMLTITGMPVDVASTSISLASGWNWLGYLPQNPGDLNTALASVSESATFIASQSSGISNNYGADGWGGSLSLLEPGSGYLINMSTSDELVYPEFDGLARLDENKQAVVLNKTIEDWDFHYGDYEFIGTVTTSIESRVDFEGDVVGVFVDDQCRGIAERMYFSFDDSYYYIIQVYSNVTDGEELTFKYYDRENDEVVEYAETLTFKNNMIVGDGFNTFGLSREARLSQPEAYAISDAYPNPFNPVTSFKYTMPEDGMVQVAIYDINGRMVSELVNGYRSAGSYPVVWDAQELSSGVYMINMISGDFAAVQKVMLIK